MNLFIIPTNTCFWLACPINDIKSYEEIYKLKSRKLNKPLSILIEDYNWLEKNTILNKDQIDFLKNYKYPFTIITKTKNNLLDKNIPNNTIYKNLAFRVAHNFIQRKLIWKYWPLFLTSANKSWNNELLTTKDILNNFSRSDNTQIFAHRNFKINGIKTASDIIEFIWESTNINFIRNK